MQYISIVVNGLETYFWLIINEPFMHWKSDKTVEYILYGTLCLLMIALLLLTMA